MLLKNVIPSIKYTGPPKEVYYITIKLFFGRSLMVLFMDMQNMDKVQRVLRFYQNKEY